MIYRLNKGYLLRGWDKSDWVLIRRIDNKARFLKAEEFQALLLCDGETDATDECADPKISEALKKFSDEGIISACESVEPIDPEQYYYKYPNRYVKSIIWSMTGKCNFRCRHCFMDAPAGQFGELDTEQALSLIDQMAACGIMRLHLTGGEPFIRKDFWQLVDRMLEYNMKIEQIYTNGWLINDALLDEFEKRNIYPEFCISFDGIGHHDWMRGISGAEERTLKAIKRCAERGFIVLVEMCVHNGNKNSIRETVRVMSEHGVMMFKVGHVSDSELWIKNCENNRMSPEEYYEEMLKYIPQYYEDGLPIWVTLGGVVYLSPNTTEYRITSVRKCSDPENCNGLLCGCARYTGYITPDGRLLPCMPMTSASTELQERFPLIKDIGLQRGLRESFYMDFISRRQRELWAVNKKCDVCQYKYQCGGGCRATAVLYGEDDLMGCDSEMCYFFENGYPDKIRAVCDAAIAKYCPDAKKDNE